MSTQHTDWLPQIDNPQELQELEVFKQIGSWAQPSPLHGVTPAQVNQDVTDAVGTLADGVHGTDAFPRVTFGHRVDTFDTANQPTSTPALDINSNANYLSQREEPPFTVVERKRTKKEKSRESRHALLAPSNRLVHQQDYAHDPNLDPLLVAESQRALNGHRSRNDGLNPVGANLGLAHQTHVQHPHLRLNQPRNHTSGTNRPSRSPSNGQVQAGPSTIGQRGNQASHVSNPEQPSTTIVHERPDTQRVETPQHPQQQIRPPLHGGNDSGPPPHRSMHGRASRAPPATDIENWTTESYHLANTAIPAQPFQQPNQQQSAPRAAPREPSTTDTTLTCSTCQRLCGNRGDYNHHQRNHVKPKICEVCGKGFADTKDLRRHRLTHDDARTFTCPVRGCGKPYKRADYVKRHMDKNHPGVRR